MDLAQVDLTDPEVFVSSVPHELFAELRRTSPVFWHEEKGGPGFWSVMRHNDLVTVNRDSATFSSYKGGSLMMSWEGEVLEQQRLMMLNMDPPMHTRYRRLVNRGFTPVSYTHLHPAAVEQFGHVVSRQRRREQVGRASLAVGSHGRADGDELAVVLPEVALLEPHTHDTVTVQVPTLEELSLIHI